MTRIWSFHGGIHPPENKAQSLRRPLTALSIPELLILPLQQHIGAPARPLVKPGDRVLKGQPIAEASGFVSAWLHAPTSGTIREIGNHPVPHPSGMLAGCIVLEADGDDRWIDLEGVSDFRSLSKQELARRIREAGLAGMGGAGFPTEIKLHLGDDHIVNTLIVNGVECEPYITADDILMRERADEIVRGIEIAAHLINPTHILIGIEDNKPEAARALQEAIRGCDSRMEVVVVPTKYPSGGERQLIRLLTGCEVPHGKLPADIGIVVQNVGTLAALHRAIERGEPLISRITTLAGQAVREPGNREVLIGTPVSHLLADGGIDESRLSRLIMGGPMMGFTLTDTRVPLIKTSNCIIAGTLEEFPPPPPMQPCIRCGACEQVCPAELLPQQLLWFARSGEHDKALAHNLMDCIECGACAWVCPSNIPLVQYYRHAKGEIRREQEEQRKAERARLRFERRNARLEAEKAEKEARRKARAEEAAKAQAAKLAAGGGDKQPALSAEDRLKAARTAAAIARTKLKKAEKALAATQEAGEPTEALEQEVRQLRQQSEAAAAEVSRLEQQQGGGGPDLKELKLAAAKARTQLSKTEKALADAEAKGLPSAEKLRASLPQLRTRAEEAQRALEAAQAKQPAESAGSSQPQPDIKALKSNLAIARTKLKKARKALEEAAAEERADLEAEVARLETRLQEAEQALAAAQPEQQPEPEGVDLKALKTRAAIARTKLKQVEKAMEQADADTRAALEADAARLREDLKNAESALVAASQE